MRKSPHLSPQEPKEAMKEKYQRQAETLSQALVSQICDQLSEALNGKQMLQVQNILKEGVHLVWRSSQGLMDEAVEPEVLATIEQTLGGFLAQHNAHASPGFSIRFDHIHTRMAGQRRFVDLHMHIPGHWSLSHAADLRGQVEQALMAAVPGLRTSIQLLPMNVETYLEPGTAPSPSVP